MTKKIRRILQPQYLKNFHCIGAACEDSCCIGWRVIIDKDTYQQYRNCTDAELSLQLQKKVTRNRTEASATNYAKIKLNTDGVCPFINEESLCAIQKKLGEEYLSVTCTTYPRVANTINDCVEKTLTMSCPEAARVALLNSELMEFDEAQEDTGVRNAIMKSLNTNDIKLAHSSQRYFWDLRILTIAILQNREYALWQRLIILGMFYNKLNQLIADSMVHEIPQLIAIYANGMLDGAWKEELEQISKDVTVQMELMKEVADERIFTGVNSQRFIECFGQFLYGIQYTTEATKQEISQRYAEAYENYYSPYMEQHEYILENYLVNFVFKNLFPFSGQKHVFDNYVMLIVHYSMIKMLLIGMAGFHKENFGEDQVLQLIQSFAKTIEHNNAYLKKIAEILKKNDFNTMGYMAILIKN